MSSESEVRPRLRLPQFLPEKNTHILEATNLKKMKDRSHRINLTIAKYDWIVFWFFVSFNLVGLFMFSVSGRTWSLSLTWLSSKIPLSKFVQFDSLLQIKIFLQEHYVMSGSIVLGLRI